jgi:hypothetical protein
MHTKFVCRNLSENSHTKLTWKTPNGTIKLEFKPTGCDNRKQMDVPECHIQCWVLLSVLLNIDTVVFFVIISPQSPKWSSSFHEDPEMHARVKKLSFYKAHMQTVKQIKGTYDLLIRSLNLLAL